MSKLDNNVLNNLKMLSLDMLKEAGCLNGETILKAAPLFYTLFMDGIELDINNSNYINRDRVIVSNEYLPLLYSMLHLFYQDITLDNLKEYQKFASLTSKEASLKTPGIEMGSMIDGDVIMTSTGIAIGERYLENLIKIENPKNNLINFKTICICNEDEFLRGMASEALTYAGMENLNNLIFIVFKKSNKKDNLFDLYTAMNFQVDEVKENNIGSIKDAFLDAYEAKKPCIIFLKPSSNKEIAQEQLLSDSYLQSLKEAYNIDGPFTVKREIYEEIQKHVHKRLDKKLAKWQSLYNESMQDLKIKEIISFLEKRSVTCHFNADNIKINDNYEDNLIISNNKILNVLANKNPFIICGSSDAFVYSKGNILKSSLLNKENPTGRNLVIYHRPTLLVGVSLGLASLGFKVILSYLLTDENLISPFIKLSVKNELDIHFIFTHDTFLNLPKDVSSMPLEEINHLRSIPSLITLRPADVNEIIGVYDILSRYHKPSAIIIGNKEVKKLEGTNYKYVVAGAYRVQREKQELNAIIISSGSEVEIACKLANELANYGFDIRVVSMPSKELYAIQNDKYQEMLLPKTIRTFTLEFSSKNGWYDLATSKDYIFGIDKYVDGGLKEELLNYYDLNMDSLKAKIIDILKNS